MNSCTCVEISSGVNFLSAIYSLMHYRVNFTALVDFQQLVDQSAPRDGAVPYFYIISSSTWCDISHTCIG